MMKPNDITAIIPAAGVGERLGLGPKAFLKLKGRTLLEWLADKAQRVAGQVVIGTPRDQVEAAQALCGNCICIAGGSTRQRTISKLFANCGRPWVMILDVARPFVSVQLTRKVMDAAQTDGAAAAFTHPIVPVAKIEQNGWVHRAFDPADMGIFQTPQVFSRTLLESVLSRAEAEGWTAQTTLQLVLRAGIGVRAVQGERTNIKITMIEDWRYAQLLEEYLT